MAVYSSTPRLGKIHKGHNGPRMRNGRKSTKTTSTVLLLIRDYLETLGDISNTEMVEFIGIDSTRLRSLRNHLVRLHAIKFEKVGNKYYWILENRDWINYDYVIANVAIEARSCGSNTRLGCLQIDCTLCGLQTRPWNPEDFQQGWKEHLDSVCHR